MTILSLVLLAVSLICLPLPAQALPEGELATSFESQVRPFFEENYTRGAFQGGGGLTLRYAARQIPNPQGTLLLVKGRTEFLAKYAELLYDLRDLPLSIYILDLRGQGASDRVLADREKGHVDDFQDYVEDLSILIDTVIKPEPTMPLVMLTHSLGGTVAALYANSHPDRVRGLILCAPMLAIKTKPFPVSIARLLAKGATFLGFGTSYVPGGGPYDPATPFAANDVTHSEPRFSLSQRLLAASPADALGSPTYGWVHQAFAGMDRLALDHRRLTMPVLLLQAGEDTVVDSTPQAAFCADLPVCTLIPLPGARHEVLMEKDAIRTQAISRVREFLERHTTEPFLPQGEARHE